MKAQQRLVVISSALTLLLSSCAQHQVTDELAVREPSQMNLVGIEVSEDDTNLATVVMRRQAKEHSKAPTQTKAQSRKSSRSKSERNAMRIARSGLVEANLKRRFRPVRATAYHHDEADHKAYGKSTAAGTTLMYGRLRSAAADWSRFPMGTVFRIVGEYDTCEYVIDDYGIALVGTDTIDLYKPNEKEMNKWGARNVVIEILEWGSYEDSLRIMRERTKWAHVKRMVDGIEKKLAEAQSNSVPNQANPELAMLREFYGDGHKR